MTNCVVVFDGRVARVIMTTHTSTVVDARILREI